jgi:hypothetical protein
MLKRFSCASAPVLLLALLMAPAFPRSAGADCPTNTMTAMTSSQVSSNYSGSLAGSFTCNEGGNIHQTATSFVTYNLVTGWVEVDATGTLICRAFSNFTTHDIFTLTGPAPGIPISFRAELRAFASVSGFGSASVMLREGASNSSPGSVLGSSTVGITITASPGSTFDLYIAGSAFGGGGAGGGAGVDAGLGFPDLPPGYLLQSCQGFVAGGAVPVRTTSWGKLKTLYR